MTSTRLLPLLAAALLAGCGADDQGEPPQAAATPPPATAPPVGQSPTAAQPSSPAQRAKQADQDRDGRLSPTEVRDGSKVTTSGAAAPPARGSLRNAAKADPRTCDPTANPGANAQQRRDARRCARDLARVRRENARLAQTKPKAPPAITSLPAAPEGRGAAPPTTPTTP